jgi:hypothetical protein
MANIFGKFNFKKIFKLNDVQVKDLLDPKKALSKVKDQTLESFKKEFGPDLSPESFKSMIPSWEKASTIISGSTEDITKKIKDISQDLKSNIKKKLFRF